MNRSESKFHNSAIKMQNALFNLLESKDFADISIMDICQKAGVNRSTFYAHYDNTHDLLQETQQAFIAKFIKECYFDSPIDMSDIQNLEKDDLNFISPKYLLPYLNYVQQNKRLFKIYANNVHSFDVKSLDTDMLENLFIPVLEKFGVTDKKLIFYMQKFFLKGMDAIVTEWVRNDCENDTLYICEIIMNCIRPISKIEQ